MIDADASRVLEVISDYTVNAPIFSRQVESATGFDGEGVRSIVNEARTLGYPIGSCRQGYFKARNYDEIRDTILNLQGRSDKIMQACNGLRDAFCHVPILTDATSFGW